MPRLIDDYIDPHLVLSLNKLRYISEKRDTYLLYFYLRLNLKIVED